MVLRVVSVNENPDVRAALHGALGTVEMFTIKCVGSGNERAEVCVDIVAQKMKVSETFGTESEVEMHHLCLEAEAQIRYGGDSPLCGDTPVLPLREALELLATDSEVFKIMFDCENPDALLTLREDEGIWILYGFSSERKDYFHVIPRMSSLC